MGKLSEDKNKMAKKKPTRNFESVIYDNCSTYLCLDFEQPEINFGH